MKSSKQVIERALRILGVLASDEPATADMTSNAKAVLESIVAEMSAALPLVPFSLVSGVPLAAFEPLARLLACDIAGDYGLAAPQPRARAWLRVRALYVTDDRLEDTGGTQDGYR